MKFDSLNFLLHILMKFDPLNSLRNIVLDLDVDATPENVSRTHLFCFKSSRPKVQPNAWAQWLSQIKCLRGILEINARGIYNGPRAFLSNTWGEYNAPEVQSLRAISLSRFQVSPMLKAQFESYGWAQCLSREQWWKTILKFDSLLDNASNKECYSNNFMAHT